MRQYMEASEARLTQHVDASVQALRQYMDASIGQVRDEISRLSDHMGSFGLDPQDLTPTSPALHEPPAPPSQTAPP